MGFVAPTALVVWALRFALAGALVYAAVGSGAQNVGGSAGEPVRGGGLALASLPPSLGAVATPRPPEGGPTLTSGSRRAPTVADLSGSGGFMLPAGPSTAACLAVSAAAGACICLALSGRRGLVRRRGPPILRFAAS